MASRKRIPSHTGVGRSSGIVIDEWLFGSAPSGISADPFPGPGPWRARRKFGTNLAKAIEKGPMGVTGRRSRRPRLYKGSRRPPQEQLVAHVGDWPADPIPARERAPTWAQTGFSS